MEDLIFDIEHMWSTFWASSTIYQKVLAISNLVGAGYTFVISFILFHKIDLIQERIFDLNTQVVKGTLVSIMIGCFFALLSIRIPVFYELFLSAGLTVLLSYILKKTLRAEKYR